MYTLRTSDLTKRFGQRNVVDHVNMSIEKGSVYGFVGENGAGKSTTLRMITNILFPTSGDVELFGKKVSAKHSNYEIRRKISGYVDTPKFYEGLNAKQNLEVIRKSVGNKNCHTVEDVLKIVHLDDVGSKMVNKFSLGMKQRLALARAFLIRPELIILDEPLNGLDPSGIQEFRGLIKEMSKTGEITFIISSHLLLELEKVATHYGFIKSGKLLQQISYKQLQGELKQYIEIETSTPDEVKEVLSLTVDDKNIKCIDDDKIWIYDEVDKYADIVQKVTPLVQGISIKKQDLEMYYMNLSNQNARG